MPKRALYERRPWLLASIAAAAGYFYLRDADLPELIPIAIKGAAVALLAVYAFLRHSSPDARLLVWALALSACGDMAIEFDLQVGGMLFFGSHLFALGLYLRNRRVHLTPSQKGVVVSLLLITPVIAFALPADRAMAMQIGIYGLTVGAMAACAWASSFPRYRVGAGAVIFVASDLLIFAGMGPLAQSDIPYVFVWPLYFLAQFLISTGVIQTLRKRDPELKVVSSQ
jgi:uncharacterized membrane protein YhhN